MESRDILRSISIQEQKKNSTGCVIDIKLNRPTLSTSQLQNSEFVRYLFIFLDIESLAKFAFTSKTILQTAKRTSHQSKAGSYFLLNLRNIAYQDFYLSQINHCIDSTEKETKDTCLRKVGRFSWLVPYFSSIGASIYGIMERLDKKSYLQSEALEFSMNLSVGECTSFVPYPQYPACDMGKNSSIATCLTGLTNLTAEVCNYCSSACWKLYNFYVESSYIGMEVGGYGTLAVGITLSGALAAFYYRKEIKQLFNPAYQSLSKLSQETQHGLSSLKIAEIKSSDKAHEVLTTLRNTKDKLAAETLLPQLLTTFTLFREALPITVIPEQKTKINHQMDTVL